MKTWKNIRFALAEAIAPKGTIVLTDFSKRPYVEQIDLTKDEYKWLTVDTEGERLAA